MSDFIEVSTKDFIQNPFQLIGKDWMLITAEHNGKANTMTASWGGLGVMWGKDVAYIVIRPQRFTKEFIDNSESFSLTFLNDDFRKTLNYLGTISGRDEDKIKNSGLNIVYDQQTPFFSEGKIVILCKKLFSQAFDSNSFLVEEIKKNWYPENDFHTLYIAEITKILTKEN